MYDGKLQALKNTAIFGSLSDKHLEMIGRVTDRVRVKQGTKLVFQGAVATHMSVIITGTATVFVDDQEVATLGPGESIGEFAMIDDRRTSAMVIADTDMTLWHIARRGFIPVWEKNPDISTAMLEGIVSKLRDTNLVLADALRAVDVDLVSR